MELTRTAGDGPILVAPRPMRIASGPVPYGHPAPFYRPVPSRLVGLPQTVDAIERMSLSDEPNGNMSPTLSEKDSSVRSASRPSMEAIEEFLSILKPSAFQSSFAGPLVPRRSVTVAAPGGGGGILDRSPSRLSPRFSPRITTAFEEGEEALASADKENVLILPRARGPYGPLGSPVSRSHTRNPFFRHPSYDMAPPAAQTSFGRLDQGSPKATVFKITSPPVVTPSPTAIPLPSPTSDEMHL